MSNKSQTSNENHIQTRRGHSFLHLCIAKRASMSCEPLKSKTTLHHTRAYDQLSCAWQFFPVGQIPDLMVGQYSHGIFYPLFWWSCSTETSPLLILQWKVHGTTVLYMNHQGNWRDWVALQMTFSTFETLEREIESSFNVDYVQFTVYCRLPIDDG